MSNEELLNKYTALAMEMQEEYLKKPQDFNKRRELQSQYSSLKREIIKRMQ